MWILTACYTAILAYLVKYVLNFVSRRLRQLASRTKSDWDDIGIDILDGLKMIVLFIWFFYIFTRSLEPSESTQRILLMLMVFASSYQIALWGFYILSNWRKSYLDVRIQKDPSASAALGLLYKAIQTILLVIIVLIALSNLGINISALIAGLGVGGIAVALAAQNILGDLLSSLSIVLDKPFVVGDFIIAGNEKGTVEQIGIKTTRLRSLSGEELVLSNKDLLESRVRNYKRMWQRRIEQKIGVTYSTPAEKIEKIPGWIKEAIEKHEKLRLDRCNFSGFGASSLDFEFIFFVQDPSFNVYMDLQEKVFLEILKKFTDEKVEFAFPSQSIYVEKMPEQKNPEMTEG